MEKIDIEKLTIDIEKLFCPEKDKLIIKRTPGDINITAKIYDEEIDLLKCQFNYDNCVEINTKDYSYITLSVNKLYSLIELIEKADLKYERFFKKLNRD
jgi:hypothetical protein